MTAPSRNAWAALIRSTYESPDLRGLPLAPALTQMGLAFDKGLATSQAVIDHLDALPKGPGTSCPDAPSAELAKMLAFRRGEVDHSDVAVWTNFMDRFMRPVFVEKRGRMIATARACGEPPDVLRFLVAAGLTAGICDKLYIEWMRRMVFPFRSMEAEAQTAFVKQWTRVLPEYDYSVFDHGAPEKGRIAWATAFPETIVALVANLAMLRTCAQDLSRPQPELIAYIDALSAAYLETDVGALETRWAEVDETWIRIPTSCRFLPVHGMENYEHPFGVSPEFRLELRVTTDEQSREIAEFRSATQSRLDCYSLPTNVREAAIGKLGTLDVGIFQAVVEGGDCLSHKLAGQVVPNRQDILARGGKVFITDPAAVQPYVDMLRETVCKHCDADSATEVGARLATHSQMRHTLGHEHFHPVGCAPDTRNKVGEAYKLLEEAKATVGGLLVDRDLNDSPENERCIAATSLARVLRFMHRSRLEDASVAPYVRENLVVLSTMLDSGIVALTEGIGLSFEPTHSRLMVWFALMEQFIADVVAAYQTGDVEKLKSMRDHLCGNDDRGGTAEANAVVAWVNRNA